MIPDMPRKLPPFCYMERSRHGRPAFYFRRGKGKRTRLPDIGDEHFDRAYLDCIEEIGPQKRRRSPAGSLAWLIERYQDSGAYGVLSPATRRQRDNIFRGVVAKAGGKPVSKVTPKGIAKGLAEREHTPSQARNYLDAVRGLFGWAVAAGLASEDPTIGIKPPKRPKTDGFAAWSEDDVAAYRARWPRGTKERVWLAVVLATGLRRGDAVTLGKQHVRDGMLMLRTAKTGTAVYVPIFADLAEAIADGPVGDLTFIVGVNGRALTKETFGNRFRMACDAAGIRGKSAHGLRKLAATRAAETGLTEAELESLFGWHGGKMASHYTKSADRKRLAERAAEKIRNAESPHPGMQFPAPEKKRK